MKDSKTSNYKECIRDFDWTLAKVVRWLFLSHFWPLLIWATFKLSLSKYPDVYSSTTFSIPFQRKKNQKKVLNSSLSSISSKELKIEEDE